MGTKNLNSATDMITFTRASGGTALRKISYGTELVTNGTFDSTSNWTQIAGSNTTITGGAMVFTNGGGYGGFYQTLGSALTAGKSYTLSFDVTSYTQGGPVFSLADTSFGVTFSSTGSYSFVTAPIVGSDPYIRLYATGSAEFTIDNVSVIEAEADRSVNGNGVQVFGTVTKTAVATGAELVAYSGFSHASGGNYLRKSYDSGLDLGTGDFVFSIWCKLTAASAQYDFLWEPQTASSSDRFYIIRNISTGNLYLPYSTNIADTFIPTGVWTKVDIVRRSNIASQYINGEKAGASYISNQNLNASAASGNFRFTHIGCYHGGLYGWNGSIALAKVSATAPTAEQIKKMYNDEKHLFATNAKATLYGTSDAVTAIAYDEDTELLHVGTSAGRSVFQGLNRVDNTTDAVGTAISASNGFIVEE